MNWNISYLSTMGILQVVAAGHMEMPQIRQMSHEALALAEEVDTYRSLLDLRNMTPALSRVEIYLLPEMLSSAGLCRTSKIALVAPADPRFRRSVCLFRSMMASKGFMLQVFYEIEEAAAWLSGITRSSRRKPVASRSYCQVLGRMLDLPSTFLRYE